jgi:hypothetical protein
MDNARVGAVLLRIDGSLFYLPAVLALRLAPLPQIARVPGAPKELLGIALHGGEILPILSIGSARESLIVCTFAGARLGLVGARIVETGMFDASADGESVFHAGETASLFDVARVCAQMQTASWGGRWGG